MCILVGCLVSMVAAQGIVVGGEEFIDNSVSICGGPDCNTWGFCKSGDSCTDPREKWPADAVVATLKKDATTMISFYSYANGYQKWEGTLTNPRQKYIPHEKPKWFRYIWGGKDIRYAIPYDLNMPAFGTLTPNLFLNNIFKFGSNNLLGLMHNEKFESGATTHPSYYSISLAFSDNNGGSWKVLGDIIIPNNNTLIRNPGIANPYDGPCLAWNIIGGTPYIIKDGFMYIYFMETKDGSENACYNGVGYEYGTHRISVARANLGELLPAAVNGKVSEWKKLSGGSWVPATQDYLGFVK